MDPLIALTDAAYEHIKKMVDDESGIGFRLSLKKMGCSGYAYVPSIAKEKIESDIHFRWNNQLSIFIDSSHQAFLKDTIIDYVHDQKTGLKQKHLVFVNPREKNRCGCGESFTIE